VIHSNGRGTLKIVAPTNNKIEGVLLQPVRIFIGPAAFADPEVFLQVRPDYEGENIRDVAGEMFRPHRDRADDEAVEKHRRRHPPVHHRVVQGERFIVVGEEPATQRDGEPRGGGDGVQNPRDPDEESGAVPRQGLDEVGASFHDVEADDLVRHGDEQRQVGEVHGIAPRFDVRAFPFVDEGGRRHTYEEHAKDGGRL